MIGQKKCCQYCYRFFTFTYAQSRIQVSLVHRLEPTRSKQKIVALISQSNSCNNIDIKPNLSSNDSIREKIQLRLFLLDENFKFDIFLLGHSGENIAKKLR